MTPSPREKHARTTCACPDCRAGCEHCPGPLIPGDLERIAAYKGVTTPDAVRQFAIEHFQASQGGGIGELVHGVILYRRVPTVVPQQQPSGRCVFLDDAGQCTIHPVSPFGCSHFDTHQSRDQGDARSGDMMAACESSPGYALLWQMLAAAGKVARPTAERKQAYVDAIDKLKEANCRTP